MKKFYFLLAAGAVLCASFLATINAAHSAAIANTATNSGTCGINCKWLYDSSNRTLTISGAGKMDNYSPIPAAYTASTAPWKDYAPDIAAVIIGDGITSIGEYAFYWCKGMQKASIAGSVNCIAQHAFHGTGLVAVSIPNSVDVIEPYAFSYSFDLESAIIGNGVVRIGEHAFDNCRSLSALTMGNNVAAIDAYAFQNCAALAGVKFPQSLVAIGANAFAGTSVELPK